MNSPPLRYVAGIASRRASSEIFHLAPGQPLPSAKEGRGPGLGRPRAFVGRLRLPGDTTTFINATLRLLVGGAFIFAGALKIADPAKFALDVSNYRLVPHELINLVAILLPWIEVTAGSLVLAGIWLKAAALVITSLSVMFFTVIMSALARGLNIECGCFGTIGGKHIGLVNLAIDSTLLLLAALLVKRSKECTIDEIFGELDAQDSAPPHDRAIVRNGQRSPGAAYSLGSLQRDAPG